MKFAAITAENSWYFRDLQRAAQLLDSEFHCVSFNDINSRIDGISETVSFATNQLDAIDAVLVRSMPPGSLEQVVFRMNALQQLAESGMPVVNPPRSMEIAIDKYLCLARLQTSGINVPETFVCQTAIQAIEVFENLHAPAVVKPVFGGEGRGLMRVDDVDLAWRTVKTLERCQSVILIQRFIPHDGFDIRIFFVGDQCFAMKRRSIDDWRTNIRRGAIAEPYQPTDEQVQTARQAAAICGCEIAGVDLLPNKSGTDYILEVNAVPGWKAIGETLQVDFARQIVTYLADRTAGVLKTTN
jgi:ribosomal protein S6--L-glutamate ligase